MKIFLKYFLRGLGTIIPFAILFVIVRQIFSLLSPFDQFGQNELIIVLVVIIFITILGFIISKGFGEYFKIRIKGVTVKMPFILYAFQSIRRLYIAASGTASIFDKPVWIIRENNERKIGFITSENTDVLNLPDYVAIYIPNPFTFFGETILLPKSSIKPIEAEKTTVVSFALSGGLAVYKEEKTIDS